MPRESKTLSTIPKQTVPRRVEPEIFIEGIDVVIKLDLGKHKELLSQTQANLVSFNEAVTHESARKRHYHRLIGKGKYDDDALKRSVKDIRVNIAHLSGKAKLSQDKIDHHAMIVETLAAQLAEYNRNYARINGIAVANSN